VQEDSPPNAFVRTDRNITTVKDCDSDSLYCITPKAEPKPVAVPVNPGAILASLPDDLAGFNAGLAELSDADYQAVTDYLNGLDGPAIVEQESVLGAFAVGVVKEVADLALDEVPYAGQAKGVYEAGSGKDIYGRDIGWLGRIGGALNSIPGGGIAKRTLSGLGAIGSGIRRGVGAFAGVSKKAERMGGTVVVKKVDDVFNAATGRLKVLQEFCFAPETLIATPGGLRPIGEIRRGDVVLAYDHRSGAWSEKSVEVFHESIYEGPLHTIHTDSGTVRTTVYHPFWVVSGRDLTERSVPRELDEREDQGMSLNGRWVNSHELRSGDVLVGQDGQQRVVLKIEQEYVNAFLVHNLTIDEDHTFAVGPDALLVHNTGGCGARERGARQQGRRMTSKDNAFDQLEEIENAQRKVRQGKIGGQIIDSIKKSQQRAKNTLDRINSLEDLKDFD